MDRQASDQILAGIGRALYYKLSEPIRPERPNKPGPLVRETIPGLLEGIVDITPFPQGIPKTSEPQKNEDYSLQIISTDYIC
jgi:hypothetical protein